MNTSHFSNDNGPGSEAPVPTITTHQLATTDVPTGMFHRTAKGGTK
jgi:hypothetical protein